MITAGMIQDVHAALGFWSWPALCVKANLIHLWTSQHWKCGEKKKKKLIHKTETERKYQLLFSCCRFNVTTSSCPSVWEGRTSITWARKLFQVLWSRKMLVQQKEDNMVSLGCLVCEMQPALQCVSHTPAGADIHSCLSKLGPPHFPQALTVNVNVNV